nr:MAG TPA: hypothetical protein [Caudoviricetes sp.]
MTLTSFESLHRDFVTLQIFYFFEVLFSMRLN